MPGKQHEAHGVLADHGDEIERRYLAGEKMPSIAARYGVTKQLVQRLLGRRGVTAADRRRVLDAKVAELASQGMTVRAIADEVDLHHTHVRRIFLRLEIPLVWDKPTRTHAPPDTIAEIIRLRKEGATIEAIAESVGRSSTTVNKHLIRHGYRTQEFRPKPRRSPEFPSSHSKRIPDE